MTELIKQILIGSSLGDGHFTENGAFQTGSKYKEWVDFKANVLKPYLSDKWYDFLPSQGYSKTPYHKLRTLVSEDIKIIQNMKLPELLENLTEVGLAVWVYDDGSFHKTNSFYNLCTHSFTQQEHVQHIIPALAKFGIIAEALKEIKKDGRVFYYTYISKRKGAEIVNKILKKYPIECYSYKTSKVDINSTLSVKSVKTTHSLTGKEIIHENLKQASIYLKSYPAKLKEVLKSQEILNNHWVNYYCYDYCSTTIPKGSRAK